MRLPHPTSRWLAGSSSAGVLVAVSLVLGACGSSRSATILNTKKIAGAIEQSSLAQRGAHVQVSCPSGVHQQKGLVFSCIAVLGHSSTRFVVTELDASGRVRYAARGGWSMYPSPGP
jgi:hypothetical protein